MLKLPFKRTLMNTSACGKEEEHNNHQHMKTQALIMEFIQKGLPLQN